MKYRIVFYDPELKPVKIEGDRAHKLIQAMNTERYVMIDDDYIAVKDIRRVEKVREERVGLPAPQTKPISKDFLQKHKEALVKKFNINK